MRLEKTNKTNLENTQYIYRYKLAFFADKPTFYS